MRTATAILALIALFVAGVLVGVLGTHAFYLRQLRQPGGLAALGTRVLARDLTRRLDLDDPQRRQLDQILADARTESAALRRDVTPRVLAILDRAGTRINAMLNSEQREEFERYKRRHRHRLHGLFAGG